MNKIIKMFPFMPPKGEVGKLVLAIVLYALVPPVLGIAVGIVAFVLALIPILGWLVDALLLILSPIIGLAGTAIMVAGIVLSIMSYLGKEVDLEKKNESQE